MFDFAITAALSLLVIVDPVGLAPIFISIAGDRSESERRRIASRAVVVAAFILLGFAAVGEPLLAYLGVSIDALRIAGGILLFKLAFDMILGHRERQTRDEEIEATHREDITIFPLAIPLMAGPGAFATVLVLVADAEGDFELLGIVAGAIIAVLILSWFSLRLSAKVTDALGTTGVNVITRVLGIILASLAVQLVADGVVAFWPTGG